MFDPALNATLVLAPVPRDSSLAFWRTPESLGQWVPGTRGRPVTADTPGGFIEIILPCGENTTLLPCSMLPVVEALDELIRIGIGSPASRSVRALAHVSRCALELVARGRLQPTVGWNGTDVWLPGPFEPEDLDLLKRLADWLPPEAFCGVPPASTTSIHSGAPGIRQRHGHDALPAPDASTAVRGLYDAVADLMPRSPAAAKVNGTHAWAGRAPTDVSTLNRDLQTSMILRRSVLQLRLSLPTDSDGPANIHVFLRGESNGFEAVAASDLWSGVAGFDVQSEQDLLFLLRRSAPLWAPLSRLLEQPAPSRVDLDADEVDDLLGDIGAELGSTGVEVMVPTELLRRMRSSPKVTVTRPNDEEGIRNRPTSGLFTIDSLCDVSWSVRVGDRELSIEEIERLVDAKRRLVRLDDGWVLLDEQLLRRMQSHDTKGATAALADALSYVGGTEPDASEPHDWARILTENVLDHRITSFLGAVRNAMSQEDFATPEDLAGVLRPYQRAGVAWMSTLITAGFGGILADDMGLGKTIQVIATHLWLRARSDMTQEASAPTLVVAPAGLLHNWSAELRRWAPTVRVHHFHGPSRSLSGVSGGDVVLTTYGIARREVTRLQQSRWGLVVADEAQAIKNRTSATAKAMRAIPSTVRFALTGTPVENHLGELWSILDWTTPGLLGNASQFEQSIITPVERDSDPIARARLNRLVGPFMLRRTKNDPRIVPELPPRTITDHPVSLTSEQAVLYKATSAEILESVRAASGMARRGAIFKLITALKQVANHPAQYLGEEGPLHGRSGKFDLVQEMVTEISESGQSLVIFTQYVRMGRLLVDGLTPAGPQPEMLHGGATLKERNELVERFQRGDLPVLVVSLRAGGVGLNLTAATHVIHYDRWWNPAVENQASDRVWRIGQTKPVQVHRLISLGTIEEKVANLLESKQQLADSVLDNTTWITELSDDQLVELVDLDETAARDFAWEISGDSTDEGVTPDV